MFDVVAGIVTYNPNIDRLRDNIAAVSTQVQQILIVDNGSENIADIIELEGSFPNLSVKALSENMGIARALNDIFSRFEGKAEWVLTLDQDSVVSHGFIDSFSKYLDDSSFVSLCPTISMRIDECNVDYDDVDIKVVPKCITSGNLVRVSVWKEIGKFREDLFIDMVDFEFCYRLHRFGYNIHQVNSAVLLHELGNPCYRRFLWKRVRVYNHNAFRKYYIVRNSMLLLKVYPREKDISYIRKFLVKTIVFTILYENERMEKIRQVIKGIHDYRKLDYSGKDL